MRCSHLADASAHPFFVRLSYLVLISLVSCARADSPEMFVADPSMQNDFTDQLPSSGASQGFTYEIIQGLAVMEGDILLGYVNEHGDLADRLRARGVGKSDLFNRWPDGIVVYEKPVNHSQLQQDNVALAIAHWTENTTLSFIERTEENASEYSHYVQFRATNSCASHVGMIGGPQPIYISDACSVGSIIHEIGHAIGLFHEHTRPDRDNFVQVDWNEIVEGKGINFDLQTANVATYSDYDYESIMHYGEKFFSISGKPTIIVADGVEIGQREGLSPLDIQSADKMYETDLALGTPALNTIENGTEIDITIYNMGTLGAHYLQLIMKIDENSQWKGVSRDSGWDCLTFDTELKCTRDTLREQTESRFTVLTDSTTMTSLDLSIALLSRTQDSDLSNNSLNDDGTEWQSAGENVEQMSAIDPDGRSTDQIESFDKTPEVSAASPDNSTPDSNTPDNNTPDNNPFASGAPVADASSGGGINLLLLTLMGMVAGMRQKRWV